MTSGRKPLISGNWKMHHSHLETIAVLQKLAFSLTPADYERVDVSIHPAFIALRSAQTVLESDDIPIALGAQNTHWEDAGAYTGEVSPTMLAKLHVRYVIVGHSERRQYFGETDEIVAKKLRAVLRAGMVPIVCVGESLAEREADQSEGKVTGQVRAALDQLTAETVAGVVVAYEPLWAIGTGRNATAEDAQAMCAAIRAAIGEAHGPEAAVGVRIQYGGSVKSKNVRELLSGPDVDGALVGGASLDAEEFSQIVAFGRP